MLLYGKQHTRFVLLTYFSRIFYIITYIFWHRDNILHKCCQNEFCFGEFMTFTTHTQTVIFILSPPSISLFQYSSNPFNIHISWNKQIIKSSRVTFVSPFWLLNCFMNYPFCILTLILGNVCVFFFAAKIQQINMLR